MAIRRRWSSARTTAAAAAALLVLAAVTAWPAQPLRGHGHPGVRRDASLSAEGPVTVGHRGMVGCAPNTIPCYRAALARGAKALEADVRITAEGVPVTFHDADTWAQTGKKHVLRELSLSELQALDAGWGYSPDGGRSHPLRGRGLAVPTLREVVRSIPEVPILLDIKDGGTRTARALERFIERELNPEDLRRLYFKASDDAVERRLMRMRPRARVALGSGRRLTLYAALFVGLADAIVPELPPTWIDVCESIPRYRDLLEKVGTWSRGRPYIVTVSTINDRELARELLGTPGLDGIVTDRPDLVENRRIRRAEDGEPHP